MLSNSSAKGTCRWSEIGSAVDAPPSKPLSTVGCERYGCDVNTSGSGSVVVFDNDDGGYLAWTRANRRGFVVNTSAPPSPTYLMLHWADFRDISGRWEVCTSGSYLKACASILEDLDRWAADTVGAKSPSARIVGHKWCSNLCLFASA